MDRLLTTGLVAEKLGTTRSRVHRAVARGLVRPAITDGGHLRFTEADLVLLKQQLGFAPTITGLSREEVLVASALLGRPLGLRSARAVARASGISPTTASRALRRLEEMALVRRRRRRVILGAPVDVDVWEINVRSRRWTRLAPMLADTVLPQTSEPTARHRRVPIWLRHLFWNADVHDLDVERDAAYIAGRILASDDAQAHAWAFATLPAEAFLEAARIRGVPVRRAALARHLATAR
jgi:DNA-binding transcriptional ArsR family regulator